MDSSALSDIISSLLANPEILQKFSAMMAGAKPPEAPPIPVEAQPVAVQPAAEEKKEAGSDLDISALMKILSGTLGGTSKPEEPAPQPAAVPASASPSLDIGSILSKLAPMLSQTSGNGNATEGLGITEDMARAVSAMASSGALNPERDKKGGDLLNALKPYMREGRRDKLDRAMKLMRTVRIISAFSKNL